MAPVLAAGARSTDKELLPEPLRTQHKYVTCGADRNYHTSAAISASQYLPVGVDNAWDFDEFRDRLAVRVTKLTKQSQHADATLEFDLVGCDPSFANALRRILIAEVATVAIEHVFVVNNTSIIADEVLAHRLGLVPLAVDARALETRQAGDAAHEKNTVVLKLDVSCRRDARDGGRVVGERVTAADLRWLPGGSQLPDETGCRFAPGGQARMFGPGGGGGNNSSSKGGEPRAVHPDLLLAKLKPGQQIALEAHCVVGTGREHAKWSPVATAWYRLLPELALLQPRAAELEPSERRALAAELPGLLFLDPETGALRAADARDHEMLLEKARRLSGEDRWKGVLEVRKRKDHFLFTVESTGAVPPDELVRRAIGVLADKARRLGQALR